MSRLEETKRYFERLCEFYPDEDSLREKVEYLIQQAERVQELELEINDWREEVQKWQQFYKESEESHLETKELLHSTVSEIKRYKQALEEIAHILTVIKEII